MTLGVLYNFGKKGITFSDEFFDAIKAMGKTGKFSTQRDKQLTKFINDIFSDDLAEADAFKLRKASEKELKQYSEEMNAISGGSSDKFLELYKKSKEGSHPYHFMTLDFKKLRVLKDFDELLFDGLNNQDISKTMEDEKENKNIDNNNKDDEEE